MVSGQDEPSQDLTPKVVPPSPSAFKFSTYGNIPLNGSTGGFSYSIPLYTVTDKDISLPISLDYYSNGVKIDELAGIVGTDWILNAGGVISRVMRGKPDENSDRWYPENIQKGVKSTDEKVYAVAEGYSNIDVERDWFSFNVNGISGTFYFDESLKPIINSKEYVKIVFNQYGSTASSFTLIDNKGYQYIFGDAEISKPTSLSIKGEPTEEYISSWFLTKIISPNQNEINLTYADNRFSYIPGISFNLLYDKECNQGGYLNYVFNYNENVSFNTIRSRVVSKIIFPNGSVNFDYNTDRPDGRGLSLQSIRVESDKDTINNIVFKYETVHTNINHPIKIVDNNDNIKYRLFLKSVQIQGARVHSNDYNDHTYLFDYYEKEKLPVRLSLSKDEYGYNNGSANSTVFSSQLAKDRLIGLLFSRYGGSYATANREVNPSVIYYGMLKEIEYPTRGYSKISYEANSTIEKVTELKYKAATSLYARKGSNIAGSENSASLKFTSNGTAIYFTSNASLVSGEPDDHDQYRVIVKDITANTVSVNRSALLGETIKTEDFGDLLQGTLVPVSTISGHEYEVTLSLESKDFNTVSAGMQMQYNAQSVTYDKTVYGGGARVKEISDYVDIRSTATNKRSFYYSALDNYPGAKTTLNKIIQPQAYTVIPYIIGCATGTDASGARSSEKVSISSSTVDLMYNNRKQSSYYTVITEFQEKDGIDNGAVEKRFHDISQDYASNPIFEKGITGAPYSNASDAYYGLVNDESVFEKESDKYSLLRTKAYTYTSLDLKLLSSYIFQQNYSLPASTTLWTDEDYIQTVSGAKYFNYVENVRCTSSIESINDGSGTLKTETTNVYGDSPYFNLKNQSVSSSTGSVLKKKYLYAPDLLGQLSLMDKLTEGSRVGMPIISETLQKNSSGVEKQIAYMKTTFAQFPVLNSKGVTKQLLLPEFVYSPTADDKRITYKKYDEYGNILHYTLNDASQTSYLWGYQGQYPIAEIKNATYEQVKAALGGATPESLSSAVDPQMDLVNGLRTELPQSQVSTYTYLPLVGMQSATDPRGTITKYGYDWMGRLITIYFTEKGKDNLVKRYIYDMPNYVHLKGGENTKPNPESIEPDPYIKGRTSSIFLNIEATGNGSYGTKGWNYDANTVQFCNVIQKTYKTIEAGEYIWTTENVRIKYTDRSSSISLDWINFTQADIDKFSADYLNGKNVPLEEFEQVYGTWVTLDDAALMYRNITWGARDIEGGLFLRDWSLPSKEDIWQMYGQAPRTSDNLYNDIKDFLFASSSDFNFSWAQDLFKNKNTSGLNLTPLGIREASPEGSKFGFGQITSLQTNTWAGTETLADISVSGKSGLISKSNSTHFTQARHRRPLTDQELGYKMYIDTANDQVLMLPYTVSSTLPELPKGLERGVALRYANRKALKVLKKWSEIQTEASEIMSTISQ